MSSTFSEMQSLMGVEGLLPDSDRGTMKTSVKVVDVKISWGRTRVLVRPLDGEGEAWIDEYTLIRREGVDG